MSFWKALQSKCATHIRNNVVFKCVVEKKDLGVKRGGKFCIRLLLWLLLILDLPFILYKKKTKLQRESKFARNT